MDKLIGHRIINWKDLHVEVLEHYRSPILDFHAHEYYELILIQSGNAKILLKDQTVEGTKSSLLMTSPGTPHFLSCAPDTPHDRILLIFTKECLEGFIPEWQELAEIFGKNGRILSLSPDQTSFIIETIKKIGHENLPLRKKLLLVYLLTYLRDFSQGTGQTAATPAYIINALSYIEEHFSEKITAQALAERLYIGRTTLMTTFKKYTGNTLAEYITLCRLKNAIQMLLQGSTEQEAAEACGLGDGTNLIRCFKRVYGMTPRQYLPKNQLE